MEFNVNSPALFVIAGLIIAAVLAQSVYFLIKAWKRGLAIGMGKEKLRRIARTAAVFTIAPAVAIVISVITLAKDLGVPLPWLRLSVVGSLSYETIAASNAEGAMGLVFGQVDSLTASQYVTIAWVMTISIMVGIWLVAIVGYVFCDFSSVFKGDFSGLIPVLVMLVSALMMGISGLAVRKLKWSWIADYALPISLIAGMASAIPITAWLG